MGSEVRIGKLEFVCLMAVLSSVTALSIDAMLPAMPDMGVSLAIENFDLPLIISFLFLGMSLGQLVFGPASDVYGRKPPIYVGLVIFVLGSFISLVAQSAVTLFLGRFLQGFGGAAPKIISVALIRDEYSGDSMAQIMSLVISVFILVPAIAPSIGQLILIFANWRAIFVLFLLVGLLVAIWFAFRQHETLAKEKRKKWSLADLIYGLKESLTKPASVVGVTISGMLFGLVVAYLGSIQILFSSKFGITTTFPLYFGSLALAAGLATLFNSNLVMKFGMRRVLRTALVFQIVLSLLFLIYLYSKGAASITLWEFMFYMGSTFFLIGFLFGNLNSLAMEPLGHIAGIGSSVLGFLQMLIAVMIGTVLSPWFQESISTLVSSYLLMALIALALLFWESSRRSLVRHKE